MGGAHLMTITKKLWFPSLVLLIFLAFCLFCIKSQVLSLKQRVSSQEREVKKLIEHIQTLKVEWVYLNAPARLEKLNAQFLKFKPAQGAQIFTAQHFFKQNKQRIS
jgi:hypothetical protein